jgi:hypothetical protein
MTEYPTDAELSAFLATHIFLWNEVRWIQPNKYYGGNATGQ